jgi:hypothetical protein
MVDSYEWKAYLRSNSEFCCVYAFQDLHRYVAAPTKCIIICKCGQFPQIAEFINPVRATRHTLSLPVIYALYYFFSISPARFLSFSISLFFSTHFLCLPYSPCSFFFFNPIFLFSLYLELRLSSFSHPIMLFPFYFIFSFCIFIFYPSFSVFLSPVHSQSFPRWYTP